MLILNRKLDESIILNDDILIKVVEIQDGRVKIGIEAPEEVIILRKELYDEVSKVNLEAMEVDNSAMDVIKKNK